MVQVRTLSMAMASSFSDSGVDDGGIESTINWLSFLNLRPEEGYFGNFRKVSIQQRPGDPTAKSKKSAHLNRVVLTLTTRRYLPGKTCCTRTD